MQMNNLNQLGALSPSDLVLVWSSGFGGNRTAPVSMLTEAVKQAVFDLINMPGGLAGIGAAASGANSDITALMGITTSRTALDLNALDATGWFITSVASSNQPEVKRFLVWNQQGDANNVAQIAVSLDSGKVYTRKKAVPLTGGAAVWSNWIANLQVGDVTSDTIGATTTGKALLTAASAAAARTALGATAIGSNLFLSIDAAAARTVLGASAIGSAIFTAADATAVRSQIASSFGASLMTQSDAAGAFNVLQIPAFGKQLVLANSADAAFTALGVTATGKAIATAADVAAAQTAIGATTVGAALLVASSKSAGRTAIDAMAIDAAPTTTARGGVLQASAQADLTAAPTQADFNALLAKLRTTGVLAAT